LSENKKQGDFKVDGKERLKALYRYNILDSDFDSRFDDLVELGAFICETPIAVINFIDKDRQWFKAELGLGIRETPLDVSICSHAILQPGLFVVQDTLKDDRFTNNPLVTGDPHLRFYAGALLETEEGHPLGTFCVLDYKPRELTDAQKKALKTLARQVMTQLELMRTLELQQKTLKELQRSHELLEVEATTDPLTKVANRRAITDALRHELRIMNSIESRRSCVLMLDLDHFKKVNDTYGHLVGDEILKNFADLCSSTFRGSDIIGRWGGEEFLIILPGIDLTTANRVVEKLHKSVSGSQLADDSEINVTFSAGLLEIKKALSEKQLLSELDSLLYNAKESGRNQIISA